MSKRNIDILRNGTDFEIAEFLSHFLLYAFSVFILLFIPKNVSR